MTRIRSKNRQDQSSETNTLGEEIFGAEYEDTKQEESSKELVDDRNKAERSGAMTGARKMLRNSDPNLESELEQSADDIDAVSPYLDTGEESSLGSNPTPDQDQVGAISEPWGLAYRSDEELDINKKLRRLEEAKETDEMEGENNIDQ